MSKLYMHAATAKTYMLHSYVLIKYEELIFIVTYAQELVIYTGPAVHSRSACIYVVDNVAGSDLLYYNSDPH